MQSSRPLEGLMLDTYKAALRKRRFFCAVSRSLPGKAAWDVPAPACPVYAAWSLALALQGQGPVRPRRTGDAGPRPAQRGSPAVSYPAPRRHASASEKAARIALDGPFAEVVM